MEQKVSVVIPVYNVEPWINKCIDSILEQTYKNIELILIDDGSSDNSGIICDEYSVKDKRIKVIHNHNSGQACSRNIGIDMAEGKYVIFIDSDDYINDNEIIEKFIDIFNRNNCDFIYTSYCRFDDKYENTITEILPLNVNYHLIKNKSGKYILNELIKNNSFHHAPYLKICKKEYIVDNNLYFKKGYYHEDAEWSFKMFYYAKKICIYNEPWYMRRMRENSTITSIDENVTTKKACDRMLIAEELITFLKEDKINSEYSIIIKDLVRMYWGDLMIIPKIKKEENLNRCIEIISKTKYILKYEYNFKYAAFNIAMNLLGTKRLLKLVGTRY